MAFYFRDTKGFAFKEISIQSKKNDRRYIGYKYFKFFKVINMKGVAERSSVFTREKIYPTIPEDTIPEDL